MFLLRIWLLKRKLSYIDYEYAVDIKHSKRKRLKGTVSVKENGVIERKIHIHTVGRSNGKRYWFYTSYFMTIDGSWVPYRTGKYPYDFSK